MRHLIPLFFFLAACRCATSEFQRATIDSAISRSVWVDTILANGDSGNCSGVLIETGHVLTARHCAGVVMKVNGTPATIIAVDDKEDLALLSVVSPERSRIQIGAPPAVGDSVLSVGTITDLPNMFTKGYVMCLPRDYGDVHIRSIVKLDAAPGISGAGVYDVRGNLIGIVTQYRTAFFMAGESKERMARHWGLIGGAIVDGRDIARFLGKAGS